MPSGPGQGANKPGQRSIHASRGHDLLRTNRKSLAALVCVQRAQDQEPGSTWAEISHFSLADDACRVLAANLFESCRRAFF